MRRPSVARDLVRDVAAFGSAAALLWSVSACLAPKEGALGNASSDADAAAVDVAAPADGFDLTIGADVLVEPDVTNDPNDPCTSSGGRWVEGTAARYVACGVPQELGAAPGRYCDCGEHRTTIGEGCYDDELCERRLACVATGGTWSFWAIGCSNPVCGVSDLCDGSAPACTCGPCEVFTPDGCELSPMCFDVSGCADERRLLCASTGGTWSPFMCGHAYCGVRPDCDGLSPGCDCGFHANFTDERGCVAEPDCD